MKANVKLGTTACMVSTRLSWKVVIYCMKWPLFNLKGTGLYPWILFPGKTILVQKISVELSCNLLHVLIHRSIGTILQQEVNFTITIHSQSYICKNTLFDNFWHVIYDYNYLPWILTMWSCFETLIIALASSSISSRRMGELASLIATSILEMIKA